MYSVETRTPSPLSLTTIAATRIVFAVERAIERAMTRKTRRLLMNLDDHILRDIGLTRKQVERL